MGGWERVRARRLCRFVLLSRTDSGTMNSERHYSCTMTQTVIISLASLASLASSLKSLKATGHVILVLIGGLGVQFGACAKVEIERRNAAKVQMLHSWSNCPAQHLSPLGMPNAKVS